MKERRSARVGTVGGLALLVGGTAVAAVAGGTHSVFSTILLGMLAVGMGHALLTELRRQARRRNTDGWVAQDTVNTALLATWAGGALTATLLAVAPTTVRAVGLLLALGYAVSCAYFVAERWRTVSEPGEPGHAVPAKMRAAGSGGFDVPEKEAEEKPVERPRPTLAAPAVPPAMTAHEATPEAESLLDEVPAETS